MKNLKCFVLLWNQTHINFIKKFRLYTSRLGEKNSPKECIQDKHNENISYKNKNYGEYTFHYWIWKNYLDKINENQWIGFCQYRKFWSLENQDESKINLNKSKRYYIKNTI